MQKETGYSTPTTSNTVGSENQSSKRRHDELTPETHGEVGKITTIDLMTMIQNSMSTLLDEKLNKLPSKDEVKVEMNRLTEENKNLQEDIKKLRDDRERDQRRIRHLEEDVGKKKLVFRGMKSQKSPYEAVQYVLSEVLKINTSPEIESSRKIFERDGKMAVLVEFKSMSTVFEILKLTKNLIGSTIYVERDLGIERRQTKKMMLLLKKDILSINKTKKVGVRDDKLIVDGKRFYWNNKQILMCGQKTGADALNDIYGEAAMNICLDYEQIFAKLESKN